MIIKVVEQNLRTLVRAQDYIFPYSSKLVSAYLAIKEVALSLTAFIILSFPHMYLPYLAILSNYLHAFTTTDVQRQSCDHVT